MSNVIKCQSITNEATGKSSLHVYDDDGNFIVVSDTPEHRDMIKRQIDWQSGVGTEYTAEQLFSDLDPTADMPSKAERVTREVNRAIRAAADQGLRRVTVPTRSFDVQSAVIATVMMNLHGRGFATTFDSGKMTVSW